ncbi:MAG: ABC transporter substrate-binding protein, partial [Firmicutes bacterium]|nr:ABC transporter substrate-binding protein [Bacillota bacterium]
VIYIPTDNTAASCTEAINGAVLPTGTPIVAGEEGICSGCGVVTLSISYYDLGYTTGKMAAQILSGEADIADMEIAYAENFTKKYNKANCDALNIDTAALEAKGYVAIQ